MNRSKKPLSFGAAYAAVVLAMACGGGGDSPGSPAGPSVNPRLTAPAPESPSNDVQLATLRPTFTVRNGTSDQPGAKTYEFSISDRSDFSAEPSSFNGSFQVV